jgi:hypothetical protein
MPNLTHRFSGLSRREKIAAEEIMILLSLPLIRGQWYWVDPTLGSASNHGRDQRNALASFETAYGKCTSGAGDGIAVLSAGTTAANTTSYLTDVITWSKHGITVQGVCSGSWYNQRARISQLSTTTEYRLINVTGNNNAFRNVSFVNTSDLSDAQICAVELSAGACRNTFENCHINGSPATASAYKCDLWLSNAHENLFKNCTFGNSSYDAGNNAGAFVYMDGASGNAQNLFEDCNFIQQVSTGTAFGGLKMGAITALNGTNIFKHCTFNVWQASTGLTAMTSWFIGSNPTTGNIFIYLCGSNGFAAWDSAGANDNVVVCNANGATAEIAAAGIGVIAS